ncbi:MAG: flagellar export chaperone FlgN [Oscillospiraceae bacterium]
MLDYQEFLNFSMECNAHYRALLSFEMKKMKMIHDDDIDSLGKALPEEQALVMKSNSLERRRADILGEENASKTFKDIISEAPLLYKRRLDNQYKELCELIGKIKEINDMAAVIINSRLARMGGKHELDTYDGRGGVSKTNGAEKHTTFNA